MFNNRLFVASPQGAIIIGAIFAQYIQMLFLPVLLCVLAVASLGAWKSSDEFKPFYRHIRKTAFMSTLIFITATAILFAGIVIDYQLKLVIPEYSIIQENPAVFMAYAANSLNIFSVMYLCLCGFIVYRSYRCLVPLGRKEALV